MMPVEDKPRVVILGGGVAGVEGLLALNDLAADRASLVLVSSQPELTFKPLAVEEPFSGDPPPRFELTPLLRQMGGRFIMARATRVRPDEHLVELDDGEDLRYDALLVTLGAKAVPPYEQATTLSASEPLPVDELISQAARHDSRTLSIVAPPGSFWPLPAYELALMTAHRANDLGVYGLKVELLTPEERPLGIFGFTASTAVEDLLRTRGIELRCSTSLEQVDDDLVCHPGGAKLRSGAVISMPTLLGPELPGLPRDRSGFIPIDRHARVLGVEDVWAAGDGADFPVKQGGLAAEQADAAARDIAAMLGAAVEPEPFEPVLRGQLLTGEDSLNIRKDLHGIEGDSRASADPLWWPPGKVVGRYLRSFLTYEDWYTDPPPPEDALEVEASVETFAHQIGQRDSR